MKKFASAAQLAERYAVNVCTIWRWAADEILAPIKLSPGCTRFDIDASDKSVLERDCPPKDLTGAVEKALQSPERHKTGRKPKPRDAERRAARNT